MPVINRVIKPRTRKAKKALENRSPKTVENPKSALFIHGQNTSEVVRKCIKDLYLLKSSNSVLFSRKHQFYPFEDILPVEWLCKKQDASLFAFISHSKKRPNNLVLGRMFDHHLLDMVEFGVEDLKTLQDFHNAKVAAGIKPCLIFCGTQFEDEHLYRRVKSLVVDFFRGIDASKVRLHGFEHAYHFTVFEGTIFCKSYRILLKKSGATVPRVELEEIGPSMTLVIRRSHLASDDLYKTACRQPVQAKVKKVKNKSDDVFGSRLGRIHMTSQDLEKLQVRKVRALKEEKQKKGETSEPGYDSSTSVRQNEESDMDVQE